MAIYPQGIADEWNNPGYGNPGGEEDDAGFFSALLDMLAATGCIDMGRVFLTGHSQGGGMAASLACRFADRVAATAPVQGLALAAPCTPTRPVPITLFYTVTDPVLPYAGGHIPGTSPTFPHQVAAEDVAAAWATTDGCEGAPIRETLEHDIDRWTWSGCDAPVTFYRLPSGNHDWMGSTFYGPGANLDLNATDVIWDFFAQRGA